MNIREIVVNCRDRAVRMICYNNHGLRTLFPYLRIAILNWRIYAARQRKRGSASATPN